MQNIYGLLVPSCTSREPTTLDGISPEHKTVSAPPAEMTNGHVTGTSEADTPLDGVVRRWRTKNLKGQRNRKSALHGEELTVTTTSPLANTLGDMKVRIFSVSPEHKGLEAGEGGAVIESRIGKVLDLVKQFDDRGLSPLGEEEGTEDRGQSSSTSEDDIGRRKLNRKSLDMFETGAIMGMVREISKTVLCKNE